MMAVIGIWASFGVYVGQLAVGVAGVVNEGVSDELIGILVGACVVGVVVLVFMCLLTALIAFHMYLICTNKTTYDFFT
jgi:hypothetical protein